jgi:hypothetical protein
MLSAIGMLSILIEKTERSDTTNLSASGGSIFNSGLSGLGGYNESLYL